MTSPHRPRVVFLHRKDLLDPGELEAAGRHFTLAESRLDLRAGDVVIPRHFAWPWPREFYGDCIRMGARPLNGLRGHTYAADLLGWTADLGDLAPGATDRFELLPDTGPFILKGEKADKGRWDRMFARTKSEAIFLRSELMADSGMRRDTIVARQYVELEPMGPAPVPGACPPSVEYRVFVFRGAVLSAAFYWPLEDCDPALVARAPRPEEIPSEFLQQAMERLPSYLEFYTLDVGRDVQRNWWVIEVSDGLRAGMSENDPERVYSRLAEILSRV